MPEDNVTPFPAPKKRPPGPGRGKRIKQGSGIPAAGPGWGGEAKGASSAGPIQDHPERNLAGRRTKLPDKQASADLMYVVWEEIALNPEAQDANRINAAAKLVDHVEGMPVARSITSTINDFARMSDGDLIAELTRATRILALSGPSTHSTPIEAEFTDVVQ